MTLNNGASHNCFYVERDITGYYTDGSLWDRIAGTNGYDEFEGIFPGEYFDMSTNVRAIGGGGSSTGEKRILILGNNYLMNNGNYNSQIQPIPNITYNHIVVCAYRSFGLSLINELYEDNPTTEGGYWGSKLNTQVIGPATTTGNRSGTINEQLYAEFGNHLKIYQELITKTVDSSGKASDLSFQSIQAIIMSECEVFGSSVWSNGPMNVGMGNSQYPTFRHDKSKIHSRVNYWLKDVVSKRNFAMVSGQGQSGTNRADTIDNIRPRFILAK